MKAQARVRKGLPATGPTGPDYLIKTAIPNKNLYKNALSKETRFDPQHALIFKAGTFSTK